MYVQCTYVRIILANKIPLKYYRDIINSHTARLQRNRITEAYKYLTRQKTNTISAGHVTSTRRSSLDTGGTAHTICWMTSVILTRGGYGFISTMDSPLYIESSVLRACAKCTHAAVRNVNALNVPNGPTVIWSLFYPWESLVVHGQRDF